MKIELMEILTFMWLLVAFITWLLTHLKSQKDLKVTNTVNLINNLSTVEHLLRSDLTVRKAIRKNIDLSPENIDEDLSSELSVLLDYYEFLSELYDRDVIDKESIEHLRGGLMLELYEKTKPTIEHWRSDLGRKDLYKKYEELSHKIASNNGN